MLNPGSQSACIEMSGIDRVPEFMPLSVWPLTMPALGFSPRASASASDAAASASGLIAF